MRTRDVQQEHTGREAKAPKKRRHLFGIGKAHSLRIK